MARSTKRKELWAVSPYMMEYDLTNAEKFKFEKHCAELRFDAMAI